MKDMVNQGLREQNVHSKCYTLLISLMCLSCIIKTNTVRGQYPEEYKILNFITKNSKNKVFYKTISTTLFNERLNNYVETINFVLCTKNIEPDKAKLTAAEIHLLKNKFRELIVEKINKKFIKNPKVLTKNKKKSFYISLPIIFRNGKCAIYYSESSGGGQFNLLIKKNDKWEGYCSSMVWIE